MSICEFGCSFGIFLNSAHLVCLTMDISKCFSASLRLRDKESQLYFTIVICFAVSFETTFYMLTLLHSERPKLYAILAFLSAIGLR